MKAEQVQVVLALAAEWPEATPSEIARALAHALTTEDPCDTMNLHLRATEWLDEGCDAGSIRD